MVVKQNSGFVRIVIMKLHRESWFYSTKFSWPYKNAAVLFKCQDPSLFNLPCPLHPFISTQTSTNHYPLPFLQIFSLLLLIVVFILKGFLIEKAFLYVLCGMWGAYCYTWFSTIFCATFASFGCMLGEKNNGILLSKQN